MVVGVVFEVVGGLLRALLLVAFKLGGELRLAVVVEPVWPR
jgi:hypothetical protein